MMEKSDQSRGSAGFGRAAKKGKPTPRYGYVIVGLAFLIMVVQWGIYYSFGIYFKPMIAEFGWSRALTSGAFSSAFIISGLVVVVMGWLNDRFGPRFVMSLCGLLLGTGCLLLSRTDSLRGFYLYYGIIIGLAMGGNFIPLISTVARWFATNRGLMTGIVASGVGVGALIGPQISSRLLMSFGWRDAYFITGIVVLVVMVPAAQFLKNHLIPRKTAGVMPLRQIPKSAHDDPHSVSLGQALGSSQFWFLSLAGFCYGYTVFSLTIHVVPNAIDLGMLPETAAGLLSVFGGLSVVGKVVFGQVLDKITSRRTMIIGFGMMTAAFLTFVFIKGSWGILAGVAIFGFFYGACTVSQSPIVATLFGLRSHGLIMGVFAVSVTIGGALGPFLSGAIYDRTASYRAAFVICAAVSVVGVMSTSLLRQKRILKK